MLYFWHCKIAIERTTSLRTGIVFANKHDSARMSTPVEQKVSALTLQEQLLQIQIVMTQLNATDPTFKQFHAEYWRLCILIQSLKFFESSPVKYSDTVQTRPNDSVVVRDDF